MLRFLTVLLTCQLVGEVVARAAGLPVPGPVLGLMFLFVVLAARRRPVPDLDRHADHLLGYLSLLFVPAGVGVVQYLPLLAEQWLPVTAALVTSVVAGIAATGLTMRILMRSAAAESRPT